MDVIASGAATTDDTTGGHVDAGPVQPFDLSDDDLVAKIETWFREAWNAKKEALRRRKRDFEFYGGHQWDEADERIAKQLKRPALTLNMVLGIISAVEGEEREERQDIKFFGNGQEDDETAWALNRILKWVMVQCGGEFELSRQFRDKIIAGEGWIVPEVDYFEDPEGLIKLLFVEDSEVFPDPLSQSPVADGDRYIHRAKRITEEEMEARWPGSSQLVREACEAHGVDVERDGSGYRDIYSAPGDTTSAKDYDAKSKLWLVKETWWSQIEPGWIVRNDQTGLLEEKTPDEFEQLRAAHEQAVNDAMAARVAAVMSHQPAVATPALPGLPAPAPELPPVPPPIEATQRPVRRIYQAFTCYKTLLEKQPSPIARLKRFPYVPDRALWDKTEADWFGLVRQIIDPQLIGNIEQSVIVQLMQLMPKSSWMGPKGSFHNKQEWQNKVAQPGSINEYNASRGKPEQIKTESIPRHLTDMAFQRPEQMRAISGVNVELTGQRQGSDPGVVMEKRAKAAKTVLAPIFDNTRRSRIELGKVLLAYIQTYIAPGRVIRILGPDGNTQVVQMTEDMSVGRYDLTIDQDSNSINDRFDALMVLQTTLPAMAKSGLTVTPDFIDLLPIPPHIRDNWKRQMLWEMALANKLPPPGWQPGQPIPGMALPGAPPPGAPPAGAPPHPAPQGAPQPPQHQG